MSELNFSIDLHCHPQYKPFARAHTANGPSPQPQSPSPSQRSSLWFYNPAKPTDKLLNILFSVTKFSQTNLTAALYGRLMVMVVALGSVEKFFFKNKLGTGDLADLIDDFAAEFGRPRINTIQGMTDYWADFMNEIDFMKGRLNQPVNIDRFWYTYRIVKNFDELQRNIADNEREKVGEKKDVPIIISIIPSIEGLHILGCGLEDPCSPATVIEHAKALKSLPVTPWFVTFSHHFYNELCGHARSLRKEIGKVTNQEEGINSGFTGLGRQVLEILLDTTNGKRIFIDMKHMSAIARKEFIQLHKTKYNSEFPLIISHGVSNGLPTLGATVSKYPELGNTFINPPEDVRGGDGEFKNHNLINFFDDEIIEVAKSFGILGLQLDERRLANNNTINKVKHSVWRHKIMHYRSELLWKQVQYIAELLDDNGLYAWGNMAIGSDYDGLVDPLNGFWTAEQYDELSSYLERHAQNYLVNFPNRLKLSENRVKADQIVQNIFRNNAWDFLKRWF